jgi:putative two-component system response regulator
MTLNKKQTILVVDDTPTNIDVVKSILSDIYLVQAAINGKMALKIIKKNKPDLILLDILMPDMDGFEVCRQLKACLDTAAIPIIFLTGKSDESDEAEGFLLGGADYIHKPVNPVILKSRVKTHLALYDQNRYLEDQIIERTKEVEKIQEATMVAMGALAETRDPETGNHIRRTQHYIKALAECLKTHPRFSDYLSDAMIAILYKSAPLHDIGKVGVLDEILLKPGKLTDEEFEKIKEHTLYGRNTILAAEAILGEPTSFLSTAREIAHYHHEKWDGSGYPEGLSGDNIPISARLMAIADVYDALISSRVYKAPMSHDKAMEIILKGKGIHFDPDMVIAFQENNKIFDLIAQNFAN